MTMDTNLKLRAASAGNLTANELTPTAVDMGEDLVPQTYMVSVPSVSGTTPTLAVVIQESDDNSTFRNVGSFESITAAGQFYMTCKCNARYRRYTATVGGTTPNFGATEIAPVAAGRYTKW